MGGATREIVHAPGATTHLVMYETEFAAVLSANEVLGEFVVGVSSLAKRHADLLAVATPPAAVVPGNEIAGSSFRELIDLMLLADRVRLDDGRLAFEGDVAPSVWRLLVQERLLGVVDGLLFRARPHYAEHVETLVVPRGRLTEKSLLLSHAIGLPRVESTFDELTMDTPVLRVVASALRVVASDHLPRRIAALRPTVQSRAVQLLRHLSSTTLIERELAILTAERLWLGSLDRAWQPALDAALPVLRERAVLPEEGETSGEAVGVHVRMEKFWEQCLQVALETAFASVAVSREGTPGEGMSVSGSMGLADGPGERYGSLERCLSGFHVSVQTSRCAGGRKIQAARRYGAEFPRRVPAVCVQPPCDVRPASDGRRRDPLSRPRRVPSQNSANSSGCATSGTHSGLRQCRSRLESMFALNQPGTRM